MKILIATIGTRGDVQPYVALGKGLLAVGHEVSLATCAHFRDFVEENGLEYSFVNDDLIAFMHSPDGKMAMENTGNLWQMLTTALRLLPKLGEMRKRQMTDLWAACEKVSPDILIYHPKAIGSPDFAEKLGIPCMLAFYLPTFVASRELPAMGFPEWPLGGWYNLLTYWVIRRSVAAATPEIKEWRVDHGLPPRSPGLEMQLPDGKNIPVMHGFSPQVIPEPSDWPDSASVVGFWTMETSEDWEPPQELIDFIEEGAPPIYVGFGSIFGSEPEKVTRTVIRAAEQAGVRVILAQGWGGLTLDDTMNSSTVMTIEVAPHDWLFPRVAAVVHHGGCGTTAAGLKAGRPTIICPFFGDQPFWGRQVEKLGVGPAPIPQKKLTADRLSAAMIRVTNDEEMRRKATELGKRLSEEDGVANAVALIERWMDD